MCLWRCFISISAVQVKDVPQAWNEKMQSYFGYQPPDDAKGCLQVLLLGAYSTSHQADAT